MRSKSTLWSFLQSDSWRTVMAAAFLFSACWVYAADTESAQGVSDSTDDIAAANQDDAEIQAINDVLANTVGEADYGESSRCISRHRIRSTEVLGNRHVAFKLSREEYAIAELAVRCPDMRPRRAVIYTPRGGSLCVLDSVQALDTSLGFAGPPCSIAAFHHVTREQFLLIRDNLKVQRDATLSRAKEDKQQR